MRTKKLIQVLALSVLIGSTGAWAAQGESNDFMQKVRANEAYELDERKLEASASGYYIALS